MTCCGCFLQCDPGVVVKLFNVRPSGELVSPVRRIAWKSPVLRADLFDASPEVPDAPGIHAFRFGYAATPSHLAVIAHCRIPPRSHAVMSPWAVRAERLIIERLLVGNHDLDLADRIRAHWRRHCDVEVVSPGQYVADTDHLGFLLERVGVVIVEAKAGELDVIRGPRWTRLDVNDGRLRLRRWWDRDLLCSRTDRLMRQRARRLMLWWYDRGGPAVRDILAPWLRYFDYLR